MRLKVTLFFLILTSHFGACKKKELYYRINTNLILASSPYRTSDVYEDADGYCLGTCMCEELCLMFTINQKKHSCSFYNTLSNFSLTTDTRAVFTTTRFTDCLDWYNGGAKTTGVYPVLLPGDTVVTNVRCNMNVKGGGWMVFQHRFNGSENFDRNWNDYKNGFGSPVGEFWLGNDNLHKITSSKPHRVLVSGTRFNGESQLSAYDSFEVKPEVDEYKLILGQQESGTIDSLSPNNGYRFTTKDKDNDVYQQGNCANRWDGKGGFWFKFCGVFYPNSPVYLEQESNGVEWYGLVWKQWLGTKKSLMATELMIRRVQQ